MKDGGIHSALRASIYIQDEAHLICLFSLHAITSPPAALVPWMDCTSWNLRPSSHFVAYWSSFYALRSRTGWNRENPYIKADISSLRSFQPSLSVQFITWHFMRTFTHTSWHWLRRVTSTQLPVSFTPCIPGHFHNRKICCMNGVLNFAWLTLNRSFNLHFEESKMTVRMSLKSKTGL